MTIHKTQLDFECDNCLHESEK